MSYLHLHTCAWALTNRVKYKIDHHQPIHCHTCLNRKGKRYCSQYSIQYTYMERESQSGRVVKQRHWFLEVFWCHLFFAKSPWPWRLGGTAPPCEGLESWNGCGRRRAATGAPRKKGNLGTQRNLCPGRKQTMRGKNSSSTSSSNSHHFASICINVASFFHLFLLVLLLVIIIILTGYADLFRHLSLFVIWESTSCKKNFIHIHSPAQPSEIWHFTGSPRPHTLNFDGWFLQLYSIIMCARRSMNTWC